jgi:hypothetical protein
VDDRLVEAAQLREVGIGVERILVARQAIDQRLLLERRRSTTPSGARSGATLPAFGPESPPKPPSPRMNSEKRFVNSGWPSRVLRGASRITSAALPLS